ncbi:hypothetical protein B0J14DRAFT_655301 [Halenospora varia]|nr:hypothetical protein B0J14DRAFT_655301 [Halenospora varia]
MSDYSTQGGGEGTAPNRPRANTNADQITRFTERHFEMRARSHLVELLGIRDPYFQNQSRHLSPHELKIMRSGWEKLDKIIKFPKGSRQLIFSWREIGRIFCSTPPGTGLNITVEEIQFLVEQIINMDAYEIMLHCGPQTFDDIKSEHKHLGLIKRFDWSGQVARRFREALDVWDKDIQAELNDLYLKVEKLEPFRKSTQRTQLETTLEYLKTSLTHVKEHGQELAQELRETQTRFSKDREDLEQNLQHTQRRLKDAMSDSTLANRVAERVLSKTLDHVDKNVSKANEQAEKDRSAKVEAVKAMKAAKKLAERTLAQLESAKLKIKQLEKILADRQEQEKVVLRLTAELETSNQKLSLSEHQKTRLEEKLESTDAIWAEKVLRANLEVQALQTQLKASQQEIRFEKIIRLEKEEEVRKKEDIMSKMKQSLSNQKKEFNHLKSDLAKTITKVQVLRSDRKAEQSRLDITVQGVIAEMEAEKADAIKAAVAPLEAKLAFLRKQRQGDLQIMQRLSRENLQLKDKITSV